MQNSIPDLIAQLHIYIFQEYSPQSWLEVSRESYLFYRNFAKSLNQTQANLKREIVENQPPVIKREEPKVKSHAKQEVAQFQKPESEMLPAKKPVSLEHKIEIKQAVTQDIPSQKVEKQDFSDIRKIIMENFSEQVILYQPPDDTIAKSVKNGWKTQSRNTLFIQNLCHALKITYGITAEVIDKKLICGDKNKHFFELEDVEVYLREPRLKAQLWKKIKDVLQ